jgi:tellurite resistance protein TehA-like permease
MHDTFIQLLEAVMLICFGVSWPVDIVHTIRVKHGSKKSLAFLVLIICGYGAGIAAKCVRSAGGEQPLEPVIWLYAANVALVAIDLALSYYYQLRAATGNASQIVAPGESAKSPDAGHEDEPMLAGVAGAQ